MNFVVIIPSVEMFCISVGIRRPQRRGGPTGQDRNDGKADFVTYDIIGCYTRQFSDALRRCEARSSPLFKSLSVTSRGNSYEIHCSFPAIVAKSRTHFFTGNTTYCKNKQMNKQEKQQQQTKI